MATPGQGRIFFAAKPAARLIRVVLLTLAVMTTVGGISGSTQGAPPKRIGILASVICPGPGAPVVPFVRRLAELGWIEGQTAIIDCVSAGGRLDQSPALAAELVTRRPDVLFGASTPVVRALRQATATIPIVSAASDPLQSGLVNNLAHPEANVTGVSQISFSIRLIRKKNSAGCNRRKKKKEKTILRILCLRTFSHRLGHKRTWTCL
jgi:putative tryptophan/tyrosine transport system substrate-binding protein